MTATVSFVDVNGIPMPFLRPMPGNSQVISNGSATFSPGSVIRVASTATSFYFKFTEIGSAVTTVDPIMPTQTVEYFKIDNNVVLSISGNAYVCTME